MGTTLRERSGAGAVRLALSVRERSLTMPAVACNGFQLVSRWLGAHKAQM